VSNKAIVVAAATVLAVAATIAIRSRDAPGAQLQALRADPMAEYAPAGGELVDTDEQNEGTTFGKPIAARYTRTFEVPAGESERILEDAVAAAEAGGWAERSQEVSLGDLVALGSKELPTGKAQLALTLFTGVRPVPGDLSAPALRVSLEHLRS
jgi:hypothetical protein